MMNKTKLLLSALLVSGSVVTTNIAWAQAQIPVEPPANTPNADEQAARTIYRSAMNFYLGKSGFEHNLDSARTLLKQSADMGYAAAQYHYGYMAERNYGNAFPNPVERQRIAIEYYTKAAQQEYAPVYYPLGALLIKSDRRLQNFQRAVVYLRKAADSPRGGSRIARSRDGYRLLYSKPQGIANLMLGDCYAYGKGVTRDKAQAITHYKKALDLNITAAYVRIGKVLSAGEPTEQDLKSAEDWYYQGSKVEVASAMAEYGFILIQRKGNRRAQNKGHNLIIEAYEKGSPAGAYYLAKLYDGFFDMLKKTKKDHPYLSEAMRREYPPALYQSAQNFLKEKPDGEFQQRTARALLLKAAENDYLPAIKQVAEGYRLGKAPFTRDLSSAYHWQKRLAYQTQNAEDQHLAGLISGQSRARLRWMRLAAAQGHFDAIKRVKYAYANSVNERLAKSNLDDLIELYNQGHIDLAMSIASVYLHSRSLKKPLLAMQWLNKAGQQGNAGAYRTLANMSVKGEGLPANLARARGYYIRAANMDDVISLLELANAYDTEPNSIQRDWVLGYQKLGKNKETANNYWRRAAQLGSTDAIRLISKRRQSN